MKEKTKGVIKTIGKNFLSLVIGGISGAILFIIYGLKVWLPNQAEKLSSGFGALFGFLALIPVTIILFGILGFAVGAVLGIIIYQIAKRGKKKNKQRL